MRFPHKDTVGMVAFTLGAIAAATAIRMVLRSLEHGTLLAVLDVWLGLGLAIGLPLAIKEMLDELRSQRTSSDPIKTAAAETPGE